MAMFDMNENCKVPSCTAPVGLRGSNGMCSPHYQRWRRHGTTDDKRATPGSWDHMKGKTGEATSRWKGDDAGYRSLHTRVERRRGPAKEHTCILNLPNCHGPIQWANVSGDYTDTDDFVPMCALHHNHFDAQKQVA